MINGDNEGLMVQENVRIPVAVKSPYHAQLIKKLYVSVSIKNESKKGTSR